MFPCTVHLTQHRDGWSVVVTPAGRPSEFHSHHETAEAGFAAAQAVARGGCGELLIVADGGVVHVPAAEVASYAWPPTPSIWR